VWEKVVEGCQFGALGGLVCGIIVGFLLSFAFCLSLFFDFLS
jgi:hypothetical protein